MKNRRQRFQSLGGGGRVHARIAGTTLAVLVASLLLTPAAAHSSDLVVLHPAYHPSDVVQDDALLSGKWEVMGMVIVFEPLGQGVYRVRLDEGIVDVRLFRVGGRLFLDAELRALGESLLPHLICRVGVTGGLALQCLNEAWVREHLAESITETDDSEILALSTDELREFLLRHGNDDEVFDDSTVLQRVDSADHLREAAEAGDASAQEQLGLAHYDGKGATEDHELAFVWTARAAAQGSASAQNRLGEMYEKGRGTDRDNDQARAWYLKAAEQDYAPAMFNLGWLYQNGYGVRKNNSEAAAWYRRSGDRDYAPALWRLGELWMEGDGVELDHRAALAAFQRAVEIEPILAEAWHSLATLLLDTWDPELADAKEAVRSAATAVALSERKNADYLDTLADAYYSAGEVKRAAVTALDALKLWSNPQRALRAQQLAFEAELSLAD